MIIGLTGSYCAGKNYAASILEQRGLPVLDVDKLGYAALEAEKAAVFSRFGRDLENADGSVNRRLLGQRVFGNKAELAALEAIVHPVVNSLTDEWIVRQGEPCVINAALLHRCSCFKELKYIIIITAPFFTRLLRAHRRDGLSWFALLRRFASQKDFGPQYLMGNADIYRVGNSGLRGRAWMEREISAILSNFE